MKLITIKELKEKSPRAKANGIILPLCDELAYYASIPFLYLPFTPNQITMIWIFIKILMVFFIARGSYLTVVVSLLIFQLTSIIDGVDGVIARYRKHFSLNGIYLDLFGHYFCNSLLLVGLGINLTIHTRNYFGLILSVIAAFVLLLNKALAINLAWYKGEERKKVDEIIYSEHLSIIKGQKQGSKKNWKTSLKIYLFDFLRIDNPLNLMFWLVLFKLPILNLLLYTLFLSFETARKLFMQYWRIHKAEKMVRSSERRE